ncbi:hypothetical protein LR69_01759 [Geobacillus sp. BCO2]|nr:hypothetical protein LR69_01759 [Geobacillus sp. BCO2]
MERWTALDAAYQSGALPAAEAKLWAAARATRDPALSLFCWLRRAAVRLGLEDEAALVRVGTIEDLPSAPSLKRLLFRFLHESGGAKGPRGRPKRFSTSSMAWRSLLAAMGPLSTYGFRFHCRLAAVAAILLCAGKEGGNKAGRLMPITTALFVA